jgi:hypothetical protein
MDVRKCLAIGGPETSPGQPALNDGFKILSLQRRGDRAKIILGMLRRKGSQRRTAENEKNGYK